LSTETPSQKTDISPCRPKVRAPTPSILPKEHVTRCLVRGDEVYMMIADPEHGGGLCQKKDDPHHGICLIRLLWLQVSRSTCAGHSRAKAAERSGGNPVMPRSTTPRQHSVD